MALPNARGGGKFGIVTPQQHRAARLAAVGYKPAQIEAELHISKGRVAEWFRTVSFQAEVAKLQERHDELIQDHLLAAELLAVKRLMELMVSEDEEIALKAAIEALNRRGTRGAPVQKQKIESLSAVLHGGDSALVAHALRDPGVRAFLESNPDLKAQVTKLLPPVTPQDAELPLSTANDVSQGR